MKKKREVEYNVCDRCEKEMKSSVICSKCSKEVCRDCMKSAPFASYCFCKDCYRSNLKQICIEFETEWETLMSQHNTECDALFKKYKKTLEAIIKSK